MHPGARVWSGALGVSLVLSIAHTFGLSDVVFSPMRASCSVVIAVCAVAWVARNPRMNLVAGLLSTVAWIDAVLVPVDLGWTAASISDFVLSLGAILFTIAAYLVMATTQVPSDRRGLAAAMSWLGFGATSLAAVFVQLPSPVVLVTLALAVLLTIRFVLGARLYDIRSDDAAASRALFTYRTALVVHVLLACVLWPLISLLGLPHSLALVLLLPYLVMIFGMGRYAGSAPHPLASVGATATVVVPLLEGAAALGALETWHARIVALVGFGAVSLSLTRFHRMLAVGCAAGFASIPFAFRFAPEGISLWIAAGWCVLVVTAFVQLLVRAEAELRPS